MNLSELGLFPSVQRPIDARLFRGIMIGDSKEVSDALGDGADSNAKDSYSNGSASHWAAVYNRQDILRVLSEHGAKLDAVDNRGERPAHWAASHGALESLRFLKDKKVDLDAKALNGWTPLYRAAFHSRTEAAAYLLEQEAVANSTDTRNQHTTLHIAAENGNYRVVELLLMHGARANVIDANGKTPERLARDSRHMAVARLIANYNCLEVRE